jgi:hypothetical protein
MLDSELSPFADYELGVSHLQIAFVGPTPSVVAFDTGLSSLEECVRSGDAAVRDASIRILAMVYGQRGVVERRVAELAGK